jgi:hypothetical protein
MSKFTDALNAAKHMVIEDDAPAAKSATKIPSAPVGHAAFDTPYTPSMAPSPSASVPFMPSMGGPAAGAAVSPFAVPSTTVLDEKVYASVLKKTNFDDSPVGKIVHKYYDALEGVIADQGQRFRAAIGQAQKLDGVTPDQVLGTFDQMQAALDADAQAFNNACATHDKNEIVTRQTSIQTKQQQVSQLNADIAQLTTELSDEQSRSANATQQHSLAQQRRANEIAQQKAQFASLLH